MDITQEMIQQAIDNEACEEAIKWLQKEPRTWDELSY
jgi:hypothetical protein